MKKMACVFIVLFLALGLMGCTPNVPANSTSTEVRTEAPATEAPTTAAPTTASTKPAEPTTEAATAAESTDDPRQTTESDPTTAELPPAFTAENIAPYNDFVTDLAYAVLQRGSVYSLSGSLELTRSEAAARFKLEYK